MKYQVSIARPAKEELRQAQRWLQQQAPEEVPRWRKEILAVIQSLRRFPKRAPLAPENKHFSKEIRQLLFGRRHGQYRILFIITDNRVRIIHIRHTARDR